MNRSRYNKIADAAYERVADGKDHFDIAEVVSEIVKELSTEDASQELIREFAHTLAEKADDKRAKRADSGQVDLFTGQPEALDAVWRIGGGKRVRVREATRDDVVSRLAIIGDNAARVAAAHDKDRRQLLELLAWMPNKRMTVAQAVQARKDAQPA